MDWSERLEYWKLKGAIAGSECACDIITEDYNVLAEMYKEAQKKNLELKAENKALKDELAALKRLPGHEESLWSDMRYMQELQARENLGRSNLFDKLVRLRKSGDDIMKALDESHKRGTIDGGVSVKFTWYEVDGDS